MPGYERAELTAELTVVTTSEAESPPREQVEAAKAAAGDSASPARPGPRSRPSPAGAGGARGRHAGDRGGARRRRPRRAGEVEAEGDAPRFDDG